MPVTSRTAAVNDQAVVAFGIDRGREIVADDRAIANFPEQIDDQNVAGFQNVDDPGILVPYAIFFFAVGENYRIHVGTLRHKDGGHDAAHEPLGRG